MCKGLVLCNLRFCLSKIWGFHGGDYEEFRFMGYRNPVHTSQTTHYVTATEPSRLMLCKIEVFTVMTIKNAVFWDVTPRGSCKSRRFGGTYRFPHRGEENQWARNSLLFTLILEAIHSTETSILTRVTRRHIQEEGIFHTFMLCWTFCTYTLTDIIDDWW
jgi:hypothetical protein